MHLIVGRVLRPHGIRGELIVDMRTDDPSDRFFPGAKYLVGTARGPGLPPEPADPAAPADRLVIPAELEIESVRPHQGRLIVAFTGIADRNFAEEMRGLMLWFDVSDVEPPDDPDEFHDRQLVGLKAVTPDGEDLGEVTRVDHGPGADMLVLRRPDRSTAYVPFVAAIVPEVDLAGGRIIITAPDGLFDL